MILILPMIVFRTVTVSGGALQLLIIVRFAFREIQIKLPANKIVIMNGVVPPQLITVIFV